MQQILVKLNEASDPIRLELDEPHRREHRRGGDDRRSRRADQKMATGDAVNVTARLEAAAPVNEILIGEVTYRLVRDAVRPSPSNR